MLDDSDPLDMLGLCRIEPMHKALFDRCFSFTRPQLSDYTFANTFIWADCIHLRWKLLHDCLCVFANGEGGLSLLFPPTGPGDFRAALGEAMEICRAFNALTGVTEPPRVEYVNEDALNRFASGGRVETMSGDYVYATQRIIDLEGGDLSSKRRCRKQFMREYTHRVEDYSPQRDLEACLGLLELWHVQSEECSPSSVLTSVQIKRTKEVAATVNALTHAAALGLRGMVLYADEKLVGFTLGEQMLDGQTCSILIEKTDRAYRGSANYIFSEFCARYWRETAWCNAGDDWEVPSLGWTKQSYRPAFRLNKWVVWPAEPVAMAGFSPAAPAAEPVECPAACLLAASVPAWDIGLAEAGDLNALVALEDHCFGQKELFNRRQLRYLLRCPRATTFAIRRDGQIVAAAILLRRRTAHGVTARVYSMAVHPDCRRQGYGTMLLDRCLETLRAEGVASVCLEVAEENIPAIRLYESMGFTPGKRLTDYYGPGEHAMKMRLTVNRLTAAAATVEQASERGNCPSTVPPHRRNEVAHIRGMQQ